MKVEIKWNISKTFLEKEQMFCMFLDYWLLRKFILKKSQLFFSANAIPQVLPLQKKRKEKEKSTLCKYTHTQTLCVEN